ncbi:MerR family transcriptional regulator [Allonocardiopsis opalescens]|nr:MerR family transcriptional regulator [Allonocardiopsis opalescens]
MKSSVHVAAGSRIDPSAELTIGELAGHFGLATHVLRHWETMGLLQPARRVSGRRRYTYEHVITTVLILQGKAAGFSLEQMRTIVAGPGREEQRAILADHLAELDRRLARLRQAREAVAHLMQCSAESIASCPSVREMAERMATGAEYECDDAPSPVVHDAITSGCER